MQLKKISTIHFSAQKLKRLPWVLADSAFLIIVCSIFLGILVQAAVFYQYVIVPRGKTPTAGKVIKFNRGAYQEVLQDWQSRDQKFPASPEAGYSNIFSK
ncbi:hypothetical protein KW786_03040 [Candidatus Parcubacteria bacterium]|nr:hypothetical protein [Candidatus Parcubacteria bacterium]